MPDGSIALDHETLGKLVFRCDSARDANNAAFIKPAWLFTDNETNPNRHPGLPTSGSHFKDAFHRYVVEGDIKAIESRGFGTKCAAYYLAIVQPDEPLEVRCRLSADGLVSHEQAFGEAFAQVIDDRIREANEFYDSVIPASLTPEEKTFHAKPMRVYCGPSNFTTTLWMLGSTAIQADLFRQSRATRAKQRLASSFQSRCHLDARQMGIPWYAAWDLAFHMIPMGKIDLSFAMEQMILFLREWYMHPNGQIPATNGRSMMSTHRYMHGLVGNFTIAAGQPEKRIEAFS